MTAIIRAGNDVHEQCFTGHQSFEGPWAIAGFFWLSIVVVPRSTQTCRIIQRLELAGEMTGKIIQCAFVA